VALADDNGAVALANTRLEQMFGYQHAPLRNPRPRRRRHETASDRTHLPVRHGFAATRRF
jgi:hypothetical protein